MFPLLREVGKKCCGRLIKCRRLGAAQKESEAWLNALRVSSLGILLDLESFWVAIALRVYANAVCMQLSLGPISLSQLLSRPWGSVTRPLVIS